MPILAELAKESKNGTLRREISLISKERMTKAEWKRNRVGRVRSALCAGWIGKIHFLICCCVADRLDIVEHSTKHVIPNAAQFDTPKCHHRLSSFRLPAHSRQLHPLADDLLASRLHHATADWEMLLAHREVIHVPFLVTQVAHCSIEFILLSRYLTEAGCCWGSASSELKSFEIKPLPKANNLAKRFCSSLRVETGETCCTKDSSNSVTVDWSAESSADTMASSSDLAIARRAGFVETLMAGFRSWGFWFSNQTFQGSLYFFNINSKAHQTDRTRKIQHLPWWNFVTTDASSLFKNKIITHN